MFKFLAFVVIGVQVLSLFSSRGIAYADKSSINALVQVPASVPDSNQSCTPTWQIVPSPNVFEWPNNVLSGVKAFSQNDVWAVGVYWGLATPPTLIEHWDGNEWKIVPSPSPGLYKSELYAVDGIAPNDVWAVGYTEEHIFEGLYSKTLIVHWNGTQWETVPSPNPFAYDNILTDIVAIAADNVWAVGFGRDGVTTTDFQTPFFLHWNGSEWSVVTAPNTGNGHNRLVGIDAVGADDIWAVGSHDYYDEGADENFTMTLAMHYNGTQWSIVSTPNAQPHRNSIGSVSMLASDDVWAVGSATPDNTFFPDTLTMHWNGTEWTIVASPNPGTQSNSLGGVVGLSSDEVYAVGAATKPGQGQSLVLRGDGNEWTRQTTPVTSGFGDYLNAVDGLNSADVWAVGHRYFNNNTNKTLILHRAPPISRAQLNFPTNGASVNVGRILLKWNPSNCATFYKLEVRRTTKNGPIVVSSDDLSNTKFKLKNLVNDKYFWRVRACNADGCGLWSKWRKFTKQ